MFTLCIGTFIRGTRKGYKYATIIIGIPKMLRFRETTGGNHLKRFSFWIGYINTQQTKTHSSFM